MARLAQIVDGKVTNVIVGKAADFPDHVQTDRGNIGDTYDGTDFIPPAPVPPPPNPRMSVGDFLDRLELNEQIALKKASRTDDTVDTMLENLKMRDTINLESVTAITMRDYLLSIAPVGTGQTVLTAARITEIFTP
jgi:hypothetical protein